MIYPRVIEVVLKLLVEKGIIVNFPHSEKVGWMIACLITVYNWMYEPENVPPSFVKAITNYSNLSKEEVMLNMSQIARTNIILGEAHKNKF